MKNLKKKRKKNAVCERALVQTADAETNLEFLENACQVPSFLGATWR